jgi:uncharacterized membrane protein
MAFFTGLLSITLFILLLGHLTKVKALQLFWEAGRLSAAIMFFQVGVLHLLRPETMVYMIEEFIPYPYQVIIFTGVTEILLAIGILWRKTQKVAGWILIVQLIAMFPANIYVAIMEQPAPGGLPSSPWYTWSRLLFQPVYIWWIWKCAVQMTGSNIYASISIKNAKRWTPTK